MQFVFLLIHEFGNVYFDSICREIMWIQILVIKSWLNLCEGNSPLLGFPNIRRAQKKLGKLAADLRKVAVKPVLIKLGTLCS